ncbi:MAG: hypothetical protein WC322_02335 [Candidatus Paceibacterota bacterium]|jgi:hypothetical protein
MKALLTAIKSALVGASTLSYINDTTGIWITPDEDMIPMTATFPSIAIKDGPVPREPLTNLKSEAQPSVHILLYQKVTSGDTSIMGQTAPAIKGILDMADDVRGVLDNNRLSIASVLSAMATDEGASEIIGSDDFVLLKKRLEYRYVQDETRPKN